jgi:uncharacterized protein (DUF952 family)
LVLFFKKERLSSFPVFPYFVRMVAYKILTTPQFAALQAGTFQGAPIDITDGYIHLSTAAQVTETLARHFAGQTDLIIATVNLDALGNNIHWEPSRGGALFPHLYATLTMEHVTTFAPVIYNPDGELILPAG